MSEESFQKYADYEVPLLQALAGLPGGQGEYIELVREFELRFGSRIPSGHKTAISGRPGRLKWQNIIDWIGGDLAISGLLKVSSSGSWSITEHGRTYLENFSHSAARSGPEYPVVELDFATSRNATLKGLAERTGNRDPAEAPTGAHATLDSQVVAIRAFLNGRASRPSDERLCDWVNFCYEFGLYREGRDLFRLVDPSQVNEWYYERAKRLARVCAMKVAGHA